jgi:hypothetical protein
MFFSGLEAFSWSFEIRKEPSEEILCNFLYQKQSKLQFLSIFKQKFYRGIFQIYYVIYSTLLYLPFLDSLCDTGIDFGIGRQTL